nr:reverse transcriptase domain-containing protein [Tanacetum cinerariifolium]
MIPEPGDPNHEVLVNETFHVQTDDEITEKELKQIEADDQAIQTILLGLLEDIYAAVDRCETAQEIWNQVIQNAVQNPNGNGNLVAARARGNATRHNGNKIRCWNCRGLGHFSKNCTIKPRRRDAAYLQTQLLIAQKEEAGIQLQAEEFDLMAAAVDLDEIEEVNANKDQYTKLLEPIPEPRQVPQNDNNVISEVSCVELSGGTVEQHPKNVEETRVLYDSLYNNLEIEVEKVNTVNRKLSETNAELTIELARYKNQQKCFEISQEKYEKLERCYQKVQNFKIQFWKEAAKFVGDFKSVAKEDDESLAKHKALEWEIERLLRAVFSQDIMTVVQNKSIVDTSNLQTELERTKEQFENCIIKKENEYAKLWNDWYKKCEECKFEKILYDKSYNDMHQKIERLQAQLEISRVKTTYKNLFDFISVTRTQSKTIINSLQNKLQDMIYENVKLRAQLFDKVSDQKDTACGTSVNTKFAKQSILRKPPKVGETHALSKPVTSNSIPTPQGSKVMKNDKVIAPGMFKINLFKPSREEKHVPNKVRASVRRSYFPPANTIPRHSRRKNTNVVESEIHTNVTMADNRTMAQMLQAPFEGYEDAIVVPQINANNFELKQTLINLVQSSQFTGRQDPHNHLRFFNKVTSTFRHPQVPNTTVKLLLFPFLLEEEAQIWLDKEPPRSILTWEDLVSKFINQFFPPSKTTYLRNEITNFLQKSNETFNEAWEHFKDLLHQCPHHGFSELHQLYTFYNAINPNDQDALDSAAGGNFLDKIPRECLSIIKTKSKVRYSRSRFTDVRANANALLHSSSHSNSFDLQQIVASLEDKLDIRMNRFEKYLNDMKNSFITPVTPPNWVAAKYGSGACYFIDQ